MSTPRSLELSPRVRATHLRTARGSFATLRADPAGGIGERHPALLVPGYTGSKEDFLSILEPLAAAGRAVTAIDLRGQYESGPAPGRAGYALDQLAADVLAVAAMLADDTGRVHVVGHSFGGLVARQAALADPKALRSLTLLCSGPGTIGGARAQALRDLLDLLAPAGDDVDQLAPLIAQALADPAAAAGAGRRHARPHHRLPRTADAAQLPAGPGRAGRSPARLPGPHLRTSEPGTPPFPILVSYGENDDAWPPDVQDLMAKRLGAERICIPQAAHSPAVEAPETTAAMLTSFWNHAESAR